MYADGVIEIIYFKNLSAEIMYLPTLIIVVTLWDITLAMVVVWAGKRHSYSYLLEVGKKTFCRQILARNQNPIDDDALQFYDCIM